MSKKQKSQKIRGGKESQVQNEELQEMQRNVLFEKLDEAGVEITEMLRDVEEKKIEKKISELLGLIEKEREELGHLFEEAEEAMGSDLEEMKTIIDEFVDVVGGLKKEYEEFVQSIGLEKESLKKKGLLEFEKIITKELEEGHKQAVKNPREYLKKIISKSDSRDDVMRIMKSDIKKSAVLDIKDVEVQGILQKLKDLPGYPSPEDFIKNAIPFVKELDEIYERKKDGKKIVVSKTEESGEALESKKKTEISAQVEDSGSGKVEGAIYGDNIKPKGKGRPKLGGDKITSLDSKIASVKGAISSIDESPEFTDEDMDNVLDLMEAKAELEEKRKAFVKAKKDFDNKNKIKTKIGRIFSRKSAEDLGIDLALARDEYEMSKAEYVGSEISKALDEQIALIEQEIWEKTKSVDKLGKAWAKIRGVYKKLGDWNLESKMKDKPKSWYGKMGARMLSVRTAISTTLLAGSYFVGNVAFGVARGGMRFVGTTGLTYDLLQRASVAKEEAKGLLADISDEEIDSLKKKEAIERLQMIEARSILDGVSLSKSKYLELYKKLQEKLQDGFEKEESLDPDLEKEKVDAVDDYLNGLDDGLKNLIKKLEKEKRRHVVEAVGAGTVVAAGIVGEAIGNLAKYIGSSSAGSAVAGWLGRAEEAPEKLNVVEVSKPDIQAPVAQVPVEPTSETIIEPVPEPVVPRPTPEEFKDKYSDSIVGDKGGVTAVLEKDLHANPKHLESFRHIKGIDKILDKYGENYNDIPKSDLNRSAWLIELDKEKGFGGEILVTGPEGNVAVIFDESAGRYKIGTLDGSKIESRLYENLDIKVSKIPTVIEPADELIDPYVKPDDLVLDKEVPTDVKAEEVYEAKKINVPFDKELLSGSTFSNFEEMADVANGEVPQEVTSPSSQTVGTAEPSIGPAQTVDVVSGAGAIDKADEIVTKDVAEVSPNVAEAENVYIKNWKEVTQKMTSLLKNNEVTGVGKGGGSATNEIFGGSGKSEQFIKNADKALAKSLNFDASDSELVSVLSSDNTLSVEGKLSFVEDEVFMALPKEYQVLFTEMKAGDPPTVFEGGAHAVKFISPSGKTFFTYNEDYIFKAGKEIDELIAEKNGVETIVEYEFVGGELVIKLK